MLFYFMTSVNANRSKRSQTSLDINSLLMAGIACLDTRLYYDSFGSDECIPIETADNIL